MTDTTELIDKAEVRDGKAIVAYSRTEHALAILRGKYKGATYDLTTTAGDKLARAARLELKTLRTDLEKKRAELKAPALLFGKTIDSEAARLTAEIQALETPIDAQIKADEKRREDERIAKEQAEAARRKVHTDGIAKIAGYVGLATDLPAERIAAGIAYLEALDLAGFEEFVTEATETRARTVSALQALHTKAVSREAEAARLEAERVEQARIAAEQAETARKLKEQQDELDRQRAEVQQREERIRKEEEARAAEKVRQEQEAELERQRQALLAEQKAAEKARQDEWLASAEAREQARQAEIAEAMLKARQDPAVAARHEAMRDAVAIGITQTTVAQDGTPEVKHIPAANVVPMPTKAPADDGARINLSEIKDRLAPIQITAEGLASLGFTHVAQEKASKLYRAADFPLICDALMAHIASVRDQRRVA